MSKKEKNTFSHFFKEDASEIQEIIHGKSGEHPIQTVDISPKKSYPKLVRTDQLEDSEIKTEWRKIRSFFRNGHHSAGLLKGLTPVILAPKYTHNLIGDDFPIWVSGNVDEEGNPGCASFNQVLNSALLLMTEQKIETPILINQKDRLIYIAHNLLKNGAQRSLIEIKKQILKEFESQIEVPDEELESFQRNLKKLGQLLPSEGKLFAFSQDTPFQLLKAAISTIQTQKKKQLKKEIAELSSKLKDLLRIERGKGPERKNPEELQKSLSFVESMVKFNELSSMLPDAGGVQMGTERVKRIKEVVQVLEHADEILNDPLKVFLDKRVHETERIGWKSLFSDADLSLYAEGQGTDSIKIAFEEYMPKITEIFVAKRVGELELENKYQADVHDDFFQHFNWENFTSDELIHCGPFIMIVDDDHLFEDEMVQISKLLSHNIPIKILAIKWDDHTNLDENNSVDEMPNFHTHAELSGMMLSHKNIFVAQSSPITPITLYTSFVQGFSAFAPAFFNILNVDDQMHENPFIWASASVESRDFPGFTYCGLLGTPWGSRFNVENNPQPAISWPVHKLQIHDQQGDLKEMDFSFTFADKAVLNPLFERYYLPVKASHWSDDLVHLTTYLENDTDHNLGKVPFIWMLNKQEELQKVAVAWPIVIATQERLDFWRFLQENSGINNYHVAKAVQHAQAKLEKEHAREIELLRAKHASEIQQTKDEEANIVMENLTSVLLNLDTTNISPSGMPAFSQPPSGADPLPVADLTDEQAETKEEEEEPILSNDPYIDTPLCTSCNECIQLNGALFHYNSDKMAYIADPRSGTFKELVEAAEMCPVGIIHPGSPLNTNEANLDELMKRAEKFN